MTTKCRFVQWFDSFSRNEFPWCLQEEFQNLKFLLRQWDIKPFPIFQNAALFHVGIEVATEFVAYNFFRVRHAITVQRIKVARKKAASDRLTTTLRTLDIAKAEFGLFIEERERLANKGLLIQEYRMRSQLRKVVRRPERPEARERATLRTLTVLIPRTYNPDMMGVRKRVELSKLVRTFREMRRLFSGYSVQPTAGWYRDENTGKGVRDQHFRLTLTYLLPRRPSKVSANGKTFWNSDLSNKRST